MMEDKQKTLPGLPDLGKYKCHICGSIFKQEFKLKVHIKYHSDTRVFKCAYLGCDASFKRMFMLTRYLIFHTC